MSLSWLVKSWVLVSGVAAFALQVVLSLYWVAARQVAERFRALSWVSLVRTELGFDPDTLDPRTVSPRGDVALLETL